MTVIGRVKFNEKGMNVYATMIATQVQNGEVTPIWPPEAAVGTLIYPKPPFGGA